LPNLPSLAAYIGNILPFYKQKKPVNDWLSLLFETGFIRKESKQLAFEAFSNSND
jgi:hypothetical protein